MYYYRLCANKYMSITNPSRCIATSTFQTLMMPVKGGRQASSIKSDFKIDFTHRGAAAALTCIIDDSIMASRFASSNLGSNLKYIYRKTIPRCGRVTWPSCCHPTNVPFGVQTDILLISRFSRASLPYAPCSTTLVFPPDSPFTQQLDTLPDLTAQQSFIYFHSF